MSKTDRIFYHERRKSFQKIKDINIKTDLKDEPITTKLLNYNYQNINQLINYESQNKKKLSIFSFKKKNHSFLNPINEDLNKTEIKFNNIELTDPSFQETLADTSFDSQKSSKTDYNNNSFEILLNENYNSYTDILKKIYPSFEFNHYNKIKDENYEYFKKYGENDINNRNSKYNIKKYIDNKEYKKSNLLDILGVQKNIEISPEKFRIKDDFLSRKDVTELKMIKEDLSFKTGIIDKELEIILQSQANKFYNYIEDNSKFVKLIYFYAEEIKAKKEKQKIIKTNYICNTMKVVLKQKKKKELEKLLNITYYINDLKKYIFNLKNLSATTNKNENIFKEINENSSLAKEKIRLLKILLKNKKCAFLINAENIINVYENREYLFLVEQFKSIVKILIENCLIYHNDKIKGKTSEISGVDKKINNKKWNLELEINLINDISFVENDFEHIDNDKNIYIKYLLLYNQINKNHNISKLIINIIDLFDIIIKMNIDNTLIISILQDMFKNIISYNLREIENQTTNKLLLIKIISNCYSILLSNFSYIIYLIQKNFNLNINNVTFIEIINTMKIEMNKLIEELINSYLNEILYEDWKYFIDGYTKAKNNCEIYFKINKLNWDEITYDIFNKFIIYFKESQTRELMNEYNKNNSYNLSWDQLYGINNKYQKMFEKLYIEKNLDKILLKQIDITNSNNNIHNLSQNRNNYIYFINEINANDCGHKISNFSCLYIKYTYEFLYVYLLTNNSSLKHSLIDQLYKVTKDLLLYTEDIIVNNPTGLINNNKKITEKEVSLYYSDLLVIEQCLKNFILIYPSQDINEILYELKNNCIDIIEDSLQSIDEIIIKEFKNIDFDDITKNGNKEINNYAKFFNKFKKIYDDLENAFTCKNIKEIFNNRFQILFSEFDQIIIDKNGIRSKKGFSQFKKDILFIKKIISIMDMIDYNKFNSLLDNYINR